MKCNLAECTIGRTQDLNISSFTAELLVFDEARKENNTLRNNLPNPVIIFIFIFRIGYWMWGYKETNKGS